MSSTILLQDFREKCGHHSEIEKYCREHNITIIRKKLNVGDYMFPDGKVSIDTKQSLLELASDLYRDKLAFNKKYKKCYQDGIKLIVLVEEPIESLNDILKFKSEHTRIDGRMLLDLMNTVRLSYGVKFMFVDKKDVGETIIKLLKGD